MKPKVMGRVRRAMIRYKELAFVSYPVTDLQRSRQFYEGTLSLTPNAPVEPGARFIEYDIGPSTVAIGILPDWVPSRDGPCVVLEVEDFPAAVAWVRERKVDVVVGPIETRACHMIVIRDPDENRVTLHRRKAG